MRRLALLASLGWIGCGHKPATSGDAGDIDSAITGPDIGTAGNPDGTCSGGVPIRGQAVDTSHPTTVVASCTFDELKAAIARGGIITFDCGANVVTIPITVTLDLRIDMDTVIDGGRKIVLDGGGAVQILRYDSPNWRTVETTVTLQHIALVNGKTTPMKAIPPAPAPCSQGFNDGEGGALFMRDGNLNVIGAIFKSNHAAPLGPDTGGGAIYILGSKHGAVIAGSTFSGNGASNAAAVGGLFAELDIYNSLFEANTAGTRLDRSIDRPARSSSLQTP